MQRTAEKCTKISAQPLFFSLNLLSSDVLVAVACKERLPLDHPEVGASIDQPWQEHKHRNVLICFALYLSWSYHPFALIVTSIQFYRRGRSWFPLMRH